MKKTLIIGGGIIGLCSAYYLRKQGHEVVVVDQSNMDYGASYVNAGYLTPSHFIPLASPGMVRKGIKWMFDNKSPLYIKPRLNSSFLKWAWAFQKSCSPKNVERSIGAIKDINILSAKLFSEIKNSENLLFQLENKGLLVLCRTEEKLKKELEVAEIAKSEGLDVAEVSASELKIKEPNVSINAIGAVIYNCDWHSTPQEFMREMYNFLKADGVVFHKNEAVIDLTISGDSIREVVTEKQRIKADEIILAAGTWSHLLGKKLGISIPMEAGKGYRIDVKNETGISLPTVLAEANVAVTPMNRFTRFGGTMEIAGINHRINSSRVNAIAEAAQRYYNGLLIPTESIEAAACGLRPVSPDGRPYIGRSNKCKNLVIATGHAMQGWSMGPATGKLVSEIVSGEKTSMNLDAFHPDRKF